LHFHPLAFSPCASTFASICFYIWLFFPVVNDKYYHKNIYLILKKQYAAVKFIQNPSSKTELNLPLGFDFKFIEHQICPPNQS
jgi:hypothetical protein